MRRNSAYLALVKVIIEADNYEWGAGSAILDGRDYTDAEREIVKSACDEAHRQVGLTGWPA